MKCIILVEPEIAENTGFIARLCHNFGFSLRLVEPKFNLEEARSTANNAQKVLREARIFDTLESSIKDLDFVVATKPGKGTSTRNFEFRANTSIVLGRESSGLSKEEIDMCDTVIHIDTQGYESFNLSHAASILMYEASDFSGKNIDSDRLDFVEKKGGKKLRELIARGSPEEGEIDKVIEELV